MIDKVSPFACLMDAIEPVHRIPHIANAKALFMRVTDTREIENGYSYCFGAIRQF